MLIDREKISFYCKFMLCISLIALWSFWFTNSSKNSSHKKIKRYSHKVNTKFNKKEIQTAKKKTKEVDDKSISKIMLKEKETSIITKVKNQKKVTEKRGDLVKELPKLAALTPTKTSTDKNSNKQKEKSPEPETHLKTKESKVKSNEMIYLNLPNVASATRKALLTNISMPDQETQPIENTTQLRKGVKFQKNRLKPALINLKKDTDKDLGQGIYLSESWINLNEEKNEKDLNKNSVPEDSDKIAEEIELSGIVSKSNGESTAIIRVKSNNYIEILKKGDRYKSLKLLEINKSDVVLVNQYSNKTYTKKINTGR